MRILLFLISPTVHKYYRKVDKVTATKQRVLAVFRGSERADISDPVTAVFARWKLVLRTHRRDQSQA